MLFEDAELSMERIAVGSKEWPEMVQLCAEGWNGMDTTEMGNVESDRQTDRQTADSLEERERGDWGEVM